ncbi:MAG: Tfx family DNA-binding protein [Methanomassiliicoccales archaeon]
MANDKYHYVNADTMTFESGLLTERQLQILSMRADGLSQVEISRKLGITRQNVSILEKRAHRNIARASRTLEMVRLTGAAVTLVIPVGTHILDAGKLLLDATDRKGIKLKGNIIDALYGIRLKASKNMKNGRLTRALSITVLYDGTIEIS